MSDGRAAPADERRVAVRDGDGEFVVVADVLGAGVADLSVGITRPTDELVLSERGTELARVALPWSAPEATTVRLHNGVLEVRLRPGTR